MEIYFKIISIKYYLVFLESEIVFIKGCFGTFGIWRLGTYIYIEYHVVFFKLKVTNYLVGTSRLFLDFKWLPQTSKNWFETLELRNKTKSLCN